MKKSNQEPEKKQNVEIVVSTYWPTKIIKSINIKKTDKEIFHNDIDLPAKDAKYLYEQLKILYEGQPDENGKSIK